LIGPNSLCVMILSSCLLPDITSFQMFRQTDCGYINWINYELSLTIIRATCVRFDTGKSGRPRLVDLPVYERHVWGLTQESQADRGWWTYQYTSDMCEVWHRKVRQTEAGGLRRHEGGPKHQQLVQPGTAGWRLSRSVNQCTSSANNVSTEHLKWSSKSMLPQTLPVSVTI